MASLMPVAKQQYFNANGVPLSGGKVYTYAAGTTSPLSTYSDKAGVTPNTNPVVLDSRGEATIFWGQAGYKVVLKDSADATIWTQDNLFAVQDSSSMTFAQELITATAGQTVFNLSISYTNGTNSLAVYMNGLRLASTDYTETSTTSVTLNTGATVGDELLFVAGDYAASTTGADLVTYTPAGTGAVATTVQTKLRESVSAADRGVDTTGATDASTALNAAIAWCIANSKDLKLTGTILLSAPVTVDTTSAPAGTFKIYGDGATVTIPNGSTAAFNCTTFTAGGLSTQGVFYVKTPDDDKHLVVFENIYFYKNNLSDSPYTGTWINFSTQRNLTVRGCVFNGAATAVMVTEAYGFRFIDNVVTSFQQGLYLRGAANTAVIRDNRFRNGRQSIVATSQLLASTTVDILIDGNYFESTTLAAITFNGVRSSIISNNYFELVDQGHSYGGVACAVVMDSGLGTNVETSSRNLFYGNYFNPNSTMYVWDISGALNTFMVNGGFNYSGTDTAGLATWAYLDNGGQFSGYFGGSFTSQTPVNVVSTLSGVTITGTAGQFSCSASSQTLIVGQGVRISGTFGGTGSITGYVNPTTYYIVATDGSTTFTLSTTPGGAGVATTAGTPTGLTYSVGLGVGWSNQGGTYRPACYWKDMQGVVHLEGALTGGTPDTTTAVFTLPAGYRPPYDHWFAITSNSAAGVLRVDPSGNITIRTGSGTSVTSLSGITFRTT